MPLSPYEMTLMVIGTVLAMGSFSFVFFGDNAFYAFNESLAIGGVAATALFAATKSLKASAFDFILAGRVTLIVPVLIGLLAFLRLTKWRWISRYTISVLSGIGVGITFGLTIRAQILNGVLETISSLMTLKPDPASAVFMLVAFITALIYFTYSIKYSGPFHTGKLRYLSRFGLLCLYASFGYLFGKIYVNEALDSVGGFFVTYLYRTVVNLRAFFG